MEVLPPDILRSPDSADFIRLSSQVIYADRPGRADILWFEVPENLAGFLGRTGSPWLVSLLPLAMTLGEPLRLPLPIDHILLGNIQTLMVSWSETYPERTTIPIETDVLEVKSQDRPERVGAFFSAGVDSIFTALHYETETHSQLDDLIAIWGFDIPYDNQSAFRRLSDTLKLTANQLGKDQVIIRTNARSTRLRNLRWRATFAPLLIGVGLSLEERYKRILISSHGERSNRVFDASNPSTDALFSTGRTEIIHYGIEYDRFLRTSYIAQSDWPLQVLRVCWESPSGENCGECEKCYRTMIALDIAGRLEEADSFPAGSFDLGRLRRLYVGPVSMYFAKLMQHAANMGRWDIADAIRSSLRYSEQLDRWLLLPHLRQLNSRIKVSAPRLWQLLLPIRGALRRALSRFFGVSV